MTTRVEFRDYALDKPLCTISMACVPVQGETVKLNDREFYVMSREHRFNDESGAWSAGYVVIMLHPSHSG